MADEVLKKENNYNKKSEAVDIINVADIINKFLFHWPLYIVVALISFTFAFLYLRYTKPVFASMAKIYIKDDKKGSAQIDALKDITGFSNNKVVENEMEIIKSPLILQDVIRHNKFNIRYFYKGRVSENELYEISPLQVQILSDSSKVGNYSFHIEVDKDKLKVQYREKGKNKIVTTLLLNRNQPFTVGKDKFQLNYFPQYHLNNYKSFQIVIDSILPLSYRKSEEIVTTLANRQATVMQISYEDIVPKRAADFLNALMRTYNQYTLDDKNQITLNTIQFIDTRLASLGGELNTLERDVENFKKTRGITEIGESSRLYLEQVKSADEQLNQADIELSIFNDIEKYVNNNSSTAPFSPVYGNVDPTLTAMIARYEEALREKRRLGLSLQSNSPILQNLDQQINDSRSSIKNYIAGFRRNAVTARSGLQRKVTEIEGLISQIPGYERQFINIKRQQSVKEQLYLYLLQKKEESSVAYASNIIDNKIISPAFIPEYPVKPKKTTIYIAFICGGLLLATIYILLKYFLNNKINTKKDIEKVSEVPVIAEIFKEEVVPGQKAGFDERSVLREQILNLRNNLKFFLSSASKSPVILFTSSISGEGKTFLSSHLANALTYNNKVVVLMELDLRKPKLSSSLGISNASGLTNYIIGIETVDQVIKKVPNSDRLYLIPSGPIPPNPVELLESQKMKDLLSNLQERFDYVIIDTSPIGLVSDAKSLAPLVDCALFVIRFNYTPKGKLKEVSENLATTDFKRVGLIFNGIEVDSSFAYSGYGYSKYGYGYGTTNDKSQTIKGIFGNLKKRLI